MMIFEQGINCQTGGSTTGPVATLVIGTPVAEKNQEFISTKSSIDRSTLKVCIERVRLRGESGSDPKVATRLRREYLPAPIVREISALYALHRRITGAGSKLMLEEVKWFGEGFVSRCKDVQGHTVAESDGVTLSVDLACKIIKEWDAMYESLEKMWRTAC